MAQIPRIFSDLVDNGKEIWSQGAFLLGGTIPAKLWQFVGHHLCWGPSPRASMIPGKWWTSHNIPIDHTTAKLEDFTDEHNTDVLPSSAFSLDLVQLDASL